MWYTDAERFPDYPELQGVFSTEELAKKAKDSLFDRFENYDPNDCWISDIQVDKK